MVPRPLVQRRRIAGISKRRSRTCAGGELDAAGCGPESSPGAAGYQCAAAGVGLERAKISYSRRNLPETVETGRTGAGQRQEGKRQGNDSVMKPPTLSLRKTERRGWGTLLNLCDSFQALLSFEVILRKTGSQTEWDSSSRASSEPPSPPMTVFADRLLPETPGEGPSSTAPWYVVQTRYRFESRVAVPAARQRRETFLPLLNETHRWSDRQKIVSLPSVLGIRIRACRRPPRGVPACCARKGLWDLCSVTAMRVRFQPGRLTICAACWRRSFLRPASISESRTASKNSRRMPRRPGRHPGAKHPEDAGHFDGMHSAIGGRHH